MVAERRLPLLGVGFLAAGVVLMALAAAFGSGPGSLPRQAAPWGVGPGGMMGFGAANLGSASDPGSPGFVAGTTAAPRVVRIVASDALRFFPDAVTVRQGETITFVVTTIGMSVHEFMVAGGRRRGRHGRHPRGRRHRDDADEVADLYVHGARPVRIRLPCPRPLRGRDAGDGRRRPVTEPPPV